MAKTTKTRRTGLPDSFLLIASLTPGVARTAGARLLDLVVSLHIEACELASVVGCVSWLLPISMRPDFMHTSMYLQQVSLYLPRQAMLVLFGALCCFQVTAMVLGGAPSVFIKSNEAQQRWLKVRRAGILFAIAVWGYLSALLTQIAVTPGSVFYGFVSLASVWGFWRLSLAIQVEEEVCAVRRVELAAAAIQ